MARRSAAAEGCLSALTADGVLATFVTVDLELGYSVRDPSEQQEFGVVAGDWSSGRPSTRSRCVPVRYKVLMAVRSQHRAAGVVDLLTAAAVEHYTDSSNRRTETGRIYAAVRAESRRVLLSRP